MTNQEVVNFVERLRKPALKNTDGAPRGPVNVRTRQAMSTNIAHLLCEEARYRWLGLVQEEDVIIDDISCIVMEFSSSQPLISKRPEHEEQPMNMIEVSFAVPAEEAIITPKVRKDPLRSSVA
jgi:hypothetical protein